MQCLCTKRLLNQNNTRIKKVALPIKESLRRKTTSNIAYLILPTCVGFRLHSQGERPSVRPLVLVTGIAGSPRKIMSIIELVLAVLAAVYLGNCGSSGTVHGTYPVCF